MTNKTLLNAHITSLSHDGRGIAHVNGKTTFIENALPDEEVGFNYLHQHAKYDEGKATSVLSPSKDRVTPECPHFGVCGGCSLQHLNHHKQLQLKQQTLLEQLQHFGQITPLNISPPITGPIWGYRHKARLGVKFVTKKNKVLVGFREKNGHYLADLESCSVLHTSIGSLLKDLGLLIQNLSNYQYIPQIEVAVASNASALVIRHLQDFSELDRQQLKDFATQHNLLFYLQPKGIDSIHLLSKTENFKNLIYRPSANIEIVFQPSDFTQINHEINKKMVLEVIKLLEPNANDQILDLFCGLGNFTLSIASLCKKIMGIEGNTEMVKRAQENAVHNNIYNAEFFCADLNNFILNHECNKIILDPPRCGALSLVKQLANGKATKIVYISCNPATLARDAGELKQYYKLSSVGILDMFPHTSHVESIALFEKI